MTFVAEWSTFLVFAAGLTLLAAAAFLPVLIASERAAVRAHQGRTRLTAAVEAAQRAEGDKIAAEMDIAGLRQLEVENAELLERSRRHVDSAVGTTRTDARAWSRRASVPEAR